MIRGPRPSQFPILKVVQIWISNKVEITSPLTVEEFLSNFIVFFRSKLDLPSEATSVLRAPLDTTIRFKLLYEAMIPR